jgi:hypothetical protein
MPFDLAALLGAGQSNDAPPDAGTVAPQDPSKLASILNPPSGGAIDNLGKAPDEVAQDVAAKTAPTRPIQAMLTNTLSMMAREFQPIQAPKPSFKQGVADAAASYAGIKTPFQNQVAARDSNMESLKTLVGANAIDFNQSRAQQTVRIGDMDMPLDVAKVYFPNYFKGVAEQGKNDRNDANIASREGMAGQRDDTKRLLGGYNTDGTLNAVGQQKFDVGTATLGLRAAQTALANAKAAGEGKRIAVAQGQLRLSQQKYLADYFGIDGNGKALPGAPVGDDGTPIGLKVLSAGAPSADRARRGDLAANALHNLDAIRAITQSHPEIFGKIGGSVAHLDDLLGSDDPNIRAIAVLGDQYALPAVGAHGLRAKGAVQDVKDDLLRSMRAGANGFEGAYGASSSSLNSLIKDEQLGKRARPLTPANPAAPAAGVIFARDPQGGLHQAKPGTALPPGWTSEKPNAR